MHPHLRPITNRDFKLPDDGFIQIAPMGEYPNPKAGVVQVIDQKACEAMKNRFDEEAKAENFPGLLVDFDHFSQHTKSPSTAAGWIEALENRADGLWAKVRWSTDGEAAVKGGNYRLLSPVWNRSQCEDLGNNRLRPNRLHRAAVTNDPVITGMVPLSNRNGSADESNMVTREEMATAIAEAVLNAGNSAGAHKGWETRRGALAAYHGSTAKSLHTYADRRQAAGANREAESVRKQATDHDALAKKYGAKAAVSGAKAHINKQLDALKSKGAASPHIKDLASKYKFTGKKKMMDGAMHHEVVHNDHSNSTKMLRSDVAKKARDAGMKTVSKPPPLPATK